VGEGPPDFVYVPTFLGAMEHYWDYAPVANFFGRLADWGRLVLFDRRGNGMSDAPVGEGGMALEEQVDDVLAVMDAAGIERAGLFAQLEGCAMASLFAATHPDRVSSLALYCPFSRSTRAPGYPFGLTVEQRQAEVIEASLEHWGEGTRGIAISPTLGRDPEFIEWFGKLERLTAAPSTMRRLFELHNHTDVRGILREVRVPTLVISRRDSEFYEHGHAVYVAERIPDARLVELPGDEVFIAGDPAELISELEEFFTGSRSERVPDRVLATVLFTDIVGSTKRAAELGDSRWRDLLDRHNVLVRRQLEHHQGREVKTIGDGFLATFDGPARGVRCATRIAEDVRRLGIEIRAGLHTGECEVLENDVAGMAVNIGARVSSMAGPGEVLVSRTVKDLVVGSGLEFADRGEHELKGVPGAWQLYEVAAAR